MGIFARVLQEILAARQGSDYSYLGGQEARSDPVWYPLRRMAVPPEVISRLKKAAASDERHATLNPIYLNYLIADLRLSDEEQTKLRAALLAQGVEMFLQDRMAAEEQDAVIEITELIYDSLFEQFNSTYAKVRAFDPSDAAGRDRTIETALELADRVGELVLAAKAAEDRNALVEAQFWRRMAITGYQEVIALIRPVEPALADEFERALTSLQGYSRGHKLAP